MCPHAKPRDFFKIDLIHNVEPITALYLKQISRDNRIRSAYLSRFGNNGCSICRPQKAHIEKVAAILGYGRKYQSGQ